MTGTTSIATSSTSPAARIWLPTSPAFTATVRSPARSCALAIAAAGLSTNRSRGGAGARPTYSTHSSWPTKNRDRRRSGRRGPGSAVGQLAGYGDNVDERAVAPHRQLHSSTDHGLDHALLDAGAGGDVLPIDGQHDVTDAQPGLRRGAPGNHLGDSQPAVPPELLDQRRRQRTLGSGDAQPGPPHPAVVHECADDLPSGRVDRHGKPDADTGQRGVHPNDPAGAVGQGTAAIAWIERRVGLDHLVDHPASPGRQGPAKSRND